MPKSKAVPISCKVSPGVAPGKVVVVLAVRRALRACAWTGLGVSFTDWTPCRPASLGTSSSAIQASKTPTPWYLGSVAWIFRLGAAAAASVCSVASGTVPFGNRRTRTRPVLSVIARLDTLPAFSVAYPW